MSEEIENKGKALWRKLDWKTIQGNYYGEKADLGPVGLPGWTLEVHQDLDAENPWKEFDHAWKLAVPERSEDCGWADMEYPDRETAYIHLLYDVMPRGEMWTLEDRYERANEKHNGKWDSYADWLLPLVEKHYLLAPAWFGYRGQSVSCAREGYSREGFFYITRKQAAEEWGKKLCTKAVVDKAYEYLKYRVEEQSDCLEGSVYGYIIKDPLERQYDSCWGFIGDWNGDEYYMLCGVIAALPDEKDVQEHLEKYGTRCSTCLKLFFRKEGEEFREVGPGPFCLYSIQCEDCVADGVEPPDYARLVPYNPAQLTLGMQIVEGGLM